MGKLFSTKFTENNSTHELLEILLQVPARAITYAEFPVSTSIEFSSYKFNGISNYIRAYIDGGRGEGSGGHKSISIKYL